MKSVKILIGVIWLAICSDQAVSNDDGSRLSSDGSVLYKLERDTQEKLQDTIVMSAAPGKIGFPYIIKESLGQTKTISNLALLSKGRIEEALTFFFEDIKKHSKLNSILIVGATKNKKLKKLIPDVKILKEDYFDVIPTLEFTEILGENIPRSFAIYRDGSQAEFYSCRSIATRCCFWLPVPLREKLW